MLLFLSQKMYERRRVGGGGTWGPNWAVGVVSRHHHLDRHQRQARQWRAVEEVVVARLLLAPVPIDTKDLSGGRHRGPGSAAPARTPSLASTSFVLTTTGRVFEAGEKGWPCLMVPGPQNSGSDACDKDRRGAREEMEHEVGVMVRC